MNNLIGVIGGLGPKATTYFMNLVIKQNIDRTETVSSSLIDTLYQLTKPDSSRRAVFTFFNRYFYKNKLL